MVEPGKVLPSSILRLPLSLSGGSESSLAGFAGRWLVLYFYPKDATPGCTTQGGDFSALLPQFRALGAEVLGVSRDSLRRHDNFRAKQGFGFALASDGDEALCRAFDVMREKTLYGRAYVGIDRSTFLLDPDGRLVQAWRGVKVPGHAQAVLDALQSAQTR